MLLEPLDRETDFDAFHKFKEEVTQSQQTDSENLFYNWIQKHIILDRILNPKDFL